MLVATGSGEDVVVGQYGGDHARSQRGRDGIEEGGLAAAGRAGDDQRVARRDREVDAACLSGCGGGQHVVSDAEAVAAVGRPNGGCRGGWERPVEALGGLTGRHLRLGGGDEAFGIGHHAGGEEGQEHQG
jgi:hypothetical protein